MEPETIKAIEDLKKLDPLIERRILLLLKLREKKPLLYAIAVNQLENNTK
jgi:hypothetical protein